MSLSRENSFHSLDNCQSQGSPSHTVHFSDTTHILHYDDSHNTDTSVYGDDVTYDDVHTNLDDVLNDVNMLVEESKVDKFAQDTFTQELTEALEQLEQMELELEQQQANHHISSNREPVVMIAESPPRVPPPAFTQSPPHTIREQPQTIREKPHTIREQPHSFRDLPPLTSREQSRNIHEPVLTIHEQSPRKIREPPQAHLREQTPTLREITNMVPILPLTAIQQYDLVQYDRRDADVASHIMERLELVEMSLNKHKVDFDDLVQLNDKLQEEMSVLQIRARRYRAPLLYRSNKAW